jgi:1,2-dihydroxy-3-keto-5-methylthiopentene dioxygenase
MSRLTIFGEGQPERPLEVLDDPEAIAGALAPAGVLFTRWHASVPVDESATQDEILAAYGTEVERLKREGGYVTADVVQMHPAHPERATLRRRFLSEHRHAEDEVRFFVRGTGLFYLHVDGRVLALQCTRGDLIRVPANTAHWFDMGEAPAFTCIRLFTEPSGWVAQFTGDEIAERFPRFEGLALS